MFVFVFKCISRLILLCFIQPPLWERYQQQVKEWVLALNKNNANIPNGFQEKAAPIEKPPTFAFCLKQWGLEVPTRGQNRGHVGSFQFLGKAMPSCTKVYAKKPPRTATRSVCKEASCCSISYCTKLHWTWSRDAA